MAHASEIADDGFAGHVFADGEFERAVVFFPFGTFDEATEANGSGFDVWHFDADELGAWDWSLDTDGFGGEVVGKLFVAGGDFAKVDAGRSAHGVLGDGRADVGAFHFDVDAKFGEGGLNNIGVLIDVAGVGGRLFFL